MRIYFLRHGKAMARADWSGDDGLRPLTGDGEKTMVREAKAIKGLKLGLELIVTSPLARARRTAEIVAEALSGSGLLIEDQRLAHGFDAGQLAQMIADHGVEESVMVVGHEPEFSETVAEVIGGGLVMFKKGGLARVDVAGPSLESGQLVWLMTPALLGGE
jgi:phosphohistidine phosphatase